MTNEQIEKLRKHLNFMLKQEGVLFSSYHCNFAREQLYLLAERDKLIALANAIEPLVADDEFGDISDDDDLKNIISLYNDWALMPKLEG